MAPPTNGLDALEPNKDQIIIHLRKTANICKGRHLENDWEKFIFHSYSEGLRWKAFIQVPYEADGVRHRELSL